MKQLKYTLISLLSVFAILSLSTNIQAQIVTTLAGSTSGFTDATGAAAQFNLPSDVATDASGNIYVADRTNHSIRKITPAGIVTTLAGSGVAGFTDATGTAAQFNNPFGVAADASGNVYVADFSNHRIRKITTGGVVTTLTGSGVAGFNDATGTAAQFSGPRSVATDASGNVYVADANNHRIRKITTGGVVMTLAGSSIGFTDATGTAAQFSSPSGVATDASGNVYVGDLSNNRIRKITTGGVVTTLAGSGAPGLNDDIGTAATFNGASGVTTDASGNVYVADFSNNRIRKITIACLQTQIVTTFAGSGTPGFNDATGTAAQFNGPTGTVTDANGNVYIADRANHRIRKITPAGVVTTLAGSGTAGFNDATGTAAQFNTPSGVAADASGNIYVADQINHRIRKITTGGVVTTLAGSGVGGFNDATGTAAQFNGPTGVATDASGNVYVADQTNHRIRKITTGGVVTTLAGSGVGGFNDATGTAAQFNFPSGVTTDASGNVYVADQVNHRIRKITTGGVVTTFAGSGVGGSNDATGTAAQFNNPYGVATDASGNVYVGDTYNHLIRKITTGGVVTTLAGSGVGGFNDDTGTTAQFNSPSGVATDVSGNVYVADQNNYRIRKITIACIAFTLPAGTTNYWTGYTSNEWEDANNWSNGTPVAGDNIYIPASTVNNLIINETVTCAKMTVQIGAKCTVDYNAGGKLLVKFQ